MQTNTSDSMKFMLSQLERKDRIMVDEKIYVPFEDAPQGFRDDIVNRYEEENPVAVKEMGPELSLTIRLVEQFMYENYDQPPQFTLFEETLEENAKTYYFLAFDAERLYKEFFKELNSYLNLSGIYIGYDENCVEAEVSW